MFVGCACCVFVRSLCDEISLVHKRATGCISVCDLGTWTVRRPGSQVGCRAAERKNMYSYYYTMMEWRRLTAVCVMSGFAKV